MEVCTACQTPITGEKVFPCVCIAQLCKHCSANVEWWRHKQCQECSRTFTVMMETRRMLSRTLAESHVKHEKISHESFCSPLQGVSISFNCKCPSILPVTSSTASATSGIVHQSEDVSSNDTKSNISEIHSSTKHPVMSHPSDKQTEGPHTADSTGQLVEISDSNSEFGFASCKDSDQASIILERIEISHRPGKCQLPIAISSSDEAISRATTPPRPNTPSRLKTPSRPASPFLTKESFLRTPKPRHLLDSIVREASCRTHLKTPKKREKTLLKHLSLSAQVTGSDTKVRQREANSGSDDSSEEGTFNKHCDNDKYKDKERRATRHRRMKKYMESSDDKYHKDRRRRRDLEAKQRLRDRELLEFSRHGRDRARSGEYSGDSGRDNAGKGDDRNLKASDTSCNAPPSRSSNSRLDEPRFFVLLDTVIVSGLPRDLFPHIPSRRFFGKYGRILRHQTSDTTCELTYSSEASGKLAVQDAHRAVLMNDKNERYLCLVSFKVERFCPSIQKGKECGGNLQCHDLHTATGIEVPPEYARQDPMGFSERLVRKLKSEWKAEVSQLGRDEPFKTG
eukprot:Gregarina_sp_Poly_1__6959@NODE_378_length_9084_cov_115_952201_g311_i0_p1_GENE_NODE_378_length_9084_cov_115_952201_g311_i0NODE_378_length_9084_cov_115_952201_g311_i0_p1_ORF_typecomplete_len568_score68_15_NODE_378_length_9084_cov_115_952201_g311_i011172820